MMITVMIITVIQRCKAPTLQLLKSGEETHMMYIQMENIIYDLTKTNT